jgi:hypothetical protein
MIVFVNGVFHSGAVGSRGYGGQMTLEIILSPNTLCSRGMGTETVCSLGSSRGQFHPHSSVQRKGEESLYEYNNIPG